MKDYYSVLGLQEGASLEEIKKAYKKYAIKFHPDKHENDEFFKERFQEIQEAFEYLTKNYEQPKTKQPKPEIINFHVSKKEISIGEFIDVHWETKNGDSVAIFLDRGKNYENLEYYDLGYSGNKRFKIDNFNDKLSIWLVLFSSMKKEDNITEEIIVKKKVTPPTDYYKTYENLINNQKQPTQENNNEEQRKREEQARQYAEQRRQEEAKRNEEQRKFEQLQRFEQELQIRVEKAKKSNSYQFISAILVLLYFSFAMIGLFVVLVKPPFWESFLEKFDISSLPNIIGVIWGLLLVLAPIAIPFYVYFRIDTKRNVIIRDRIKKEMETENHSGQS